MSLNKCAACNKLFEVDDLVQALIYARYIPLKSNVATALSKPVDWEAGSLRHVFCQDPKGEDHGLSDISSR